MTSILEEADNIAGEDRSRDYGHPYLNHQRIAAIWNVQLAGILTAPITPRQVALMMIGVKLAREANTPKRDNLIDIAGYVKCIDMIDEVCTMTPHVECKPEESSDNSVRLAVHFQSLSEAAENIRRAYRQNNDVAFDDAIEQMLGAKK